MKHGNLFWGGILVTLGALFILKNTGIFYFNWISIFSLWPIVLVILGVSLLPIKNSIKSLLTIILIFFTVSLVFTKSKHWSSTYNFKWDIDNDWDIESFKKERQEKTKHYFYQPLEADIKEATLNIDAVAGKLFIHRKSKHLIELDQESNIGTYIFSTEKKNDQRTLNFDIKKNVFKPYRINNDIEIKLNDEPTWNLNIITGAASVDLDLTNFKTKKIDIDGGASSVYVRLGDKFNNTDVVLDSGVSSIEIFIPEESGCQINTNTILASKSFDDFEKIRKGLYKTSNFENSNNKIYINIDAAICSLEIVRY